MIVVDSSVWVDHLRRRDAALVDLLSAHRVACHPFVIGEVACGRLDNRHEVLGLLAALPAAPVLSPEEALAFLEARALDGSGIGWIDVHLLGSAVLGRHQLWTRDGRLQDAAKRVGVASEERA